MRQRRQLAGEEVRRQVVVEGKSGKAEEKEAFERSFLGWIELKVS